MARTSVYSMLHVTSTLDGRRVEGFYEGDDAITVAQGDDIGTGIVGADGASIFSQHADRSAQVTLRLMHTSAMHAFLMRKLQRQREGQVVGFPFTVIDRNSGEGGSAAECFIQSAPDDQKGKTAQVREWVLWTGDYRNEIPNG